MSYKNLAVGREEFYVQTGSMFENPHGVPHPEIVRMILENTPEVAAQTVFGKYVEASGLVFTGELIQMMIDRVTLPRVLGNSWVDKSARDTARAEHKHLQYWGDRYHTGVDFARQTDFTVITTIDVSQMPARMVYYKRLNRVPWDAIYAEVGLARAFFGPNILCDGSGPGGDVVMDALESRLYCPAHHKAVLFDSRCMKEGRFRSCDPQDYLPLSCCEAFYFTGGSKKELVEHLRNVLSIGYDSSTPEEDFGWLRTPQIAQLEEELSFYSWDDKRLDTDCLFSLALATWSGLEEIVPAVVTGSIYGN